MKRIIEFLIFLMAPAFVVAQTPPPFKVYNDLWAMSDIYWKKHDKATSTPPDSVLVVKANLVYVYTGGVAAPSDTLDWLASTYYVDHSLSLIDTSLWARLFGHLYPKIVTDSVIIGANEVPKSLFEVKDLLQFYNLTNSIYAGPLCPFGAPGSDNVALGGGSLNYLATGTGSYNTSVGCNSLGSVIDGEHNTAYGQGAGLNFEGSHSTFIGDRAGMQVYHGDYMTIVGAQAGQGATGADSSIMLGHQAGSYETENGRLYIDNAARDVTGHDSLSRNNARKTALVYGVMDKYPANQMLRVNGHLELPYENTMNSDTFLVIKPTTGEIGYDITAGLAWSDTTGRPGLATRYDLDTLSVCPWSLDGTQVTTQYPVLVPNIFRQGDTTADHTKIEGSNVFLGREDTSASIGYTYNAEDDTKELTVGTGTATWSARETVGGTNTLVTATADTFDLKAYLKPTLDTLTSDTSWVVCPTTRKTGWRIIPGGGLAWSDTATSPGLATAYDLTQISTLSAIPINNFIYVDARGGNDATAKVGDLAHPFKTLRAAVDSFSTGKAIIVYPGTYEEETTSNGGEGFNICRQSDGTYITPVAYFYKGARLVKKGGTGNLIASTTTGAYIHGEGSFLRTTSGTNCRVVTVTQFMYMEADSIYCTLGYAVASNGTGSVFKVKYAESTANSTYIGKNFNLIGRTNIITCSAAATVVYIDNATNYCTFEGIFTGLSGQRCIHGYGAMNGCMISGEFYTATTAVECYGGGSVEINCYRSTCTNLYYSNGAASFYHNATIYTLNGGGVIKQDGAAGGMIEVHVNGGSIPYINIASGTIKLHGKVQNVYSTSGTWITISGGKLIIEGNFEFGGGLNYGFIKQTGGTLIINGALYDNCTVNGGYYQSSMLNVNAAGGTLVIGANASINDKSTSSSVNGVIGIGFNTNVIVNGGVLSGNTGDWGMMVMANNSGDNNDTVAVSLYGYGNLYSTSPFSTRASTRKSNNLSSGYDFNANPKSFLINYNGGGDKTMNLTTDCNTIQDVIDAVNAELTVEGLTDLECVLSTATTMKLRNKFSTTADGNMISEIVLTEVDALAVLGWAAGTYKAAIYVKGNGTGALKFDANNIIY